MLTRITIPRPHVPYGPECLTDDASDVHYLREVVRKIDNGHIVVGGSNVTATIRKLIADAADTIGSPAGTPGRDVVQLVRDLTDPDDCWFDHHGGCQAHGYLSLEPGEVCPHLEAKAWLTKVGA